MKLTQEQYASYYQSRVADFRPGHLSQMCRCCFHPDSTASMSVNVEKGSWYCFACRIGGGPVEFETRFSTCDAETARANIGEIIGEPQRILAPGKPPEAVYEYRDPEGRIVVEKLRYPGKRFVQRRPDGNGGYDYKLGNATRLLYNLPEVITANQVVISEGEKDANRVAAANLAQYDSKQSSRVASTTNIDGAGKWRPEYSPYFAGKSVAILPDNDEIGREHAARVAASVAPYAHVVRIVNLPGLPEKGDVSDYLDSHDPKELLAEIRKTAPWKPTKSGLLVDATAFDAAYEPEIDWFVEGVIQRGANGFICAAPKGGKSWVAVDLAVSLALGVPWLGFRVKVPCRVGLISREDNPALTKWRMRQIARGKGVDMADLGDRVWINSRSQSPEFRLDKPEQLSEMIAELKRVAPEFVILDVFNVLHSAEENDNTEMRAVLELLNTIHREVNCSLCILHHFSKASEGSMTQRLRGSSAIAGWAEWIIGLEPDKVHRKMSFELKAAGPPEPIHFAIDSDNGSGPVVERRAAPPPGAAKGGRVEELLQ